MAVYVERTMINITAIILTKNSENDLADCIESVRFCDEIIVIDDASIDRTVEIATHLGVKVISFTTKSFAARRNYALKKAKGKWILYVDVDERVAPELRSAIEEVIQEKKGEQVSYKLQRKNFYFGNHEWPMIEQLERLFKRDSLQEWYGAVHETPIVNG